MNYINCPSYSSIYYALDLINDGADVMILTSNASVVKYCEVTKINVKYYSNIHLGFWKATRIKTFKRQLDILYSSLQISPKDTFYLLDNSFTVEGFYLGFLFSGKCHLKYFKMDRVEFTRLTIDEVKNIKPLLNALFVVVSIKMVLHLRLILKYSNSNPVICIDNNYISRHNFSEISGIESPEYYKRKAIKNYSIVAKKYKTMLADQGDQSGIIEFNSLNKVLQWIIMEAKDIVIKEHPNFKNNLIYKTVEKYPDYYPSELLLINIEACVISIYSATLIHASLNNNIQSISLLDLVVWNDNSYKESRREWLIHNSQNRILFPSSLNELMKFI
jgi:hypothetical protein